MSDNVDHGATGVVFDPRTKVTLGLLAKGFALLAALAGPCLGDSVTYTIKTPGAVSVGVFDSEDRLVRTLQSGKRQPAGTYSLDWDHKDDAGNVLPPGPYVGKGLAAKVGCEYITMMGNSGTPPYPTDDGLGGWGGVWGNVLGGVAAPDGKSLYLLWGQEEGTPALLKIDPRGDARGRNKL